MCDEVLADAFARAKRLVDGRIHPCALGLILEIPMDCGRDVPCRRQRIGRSTARRTDRVRIGDQRRRPHREAAWLAQVPMRVMPGPFVNLEPCGGVERLRKFRGWFDLNVGARRDTERLVARGNTEVVDPVRKMVAEGVRPGVRLDVEYVSQAGLPFAGARLHPHFHVTLADRRVVVEPGDVRDRVTHASSCVGRGPRPADRPRQDSRRIAGAPPR